MFKGHQFVKLVNDNWVLDLTEYIGYKVKVNDKREVESYRKAFEVTHDVDDLVFEKFIRVPIKVLKEASATIREHEQFIGESV